MSAWAWPTGFLIAVAVAFGGVAAFSAHERAAGAAVAKADFDRDTAAALKKAQADADQKTAAVEKAHAEDIRRRDARIASGAAARTELERLRQQLASADSAASGAGTGPGADDAAVYRGLLGACAGRYEGVAADAGKFAAQVIGLQNYVRATCLPRQGIESGGPPVGVGSRAGGNALVIQPTTAPSRLTPGEAAPPQGLEP